MATERLSTTTSGDKATAARTPIQFMYAQWEAAWDASTANEQAEHSAAEDKRPTITFDRAQTASTERAAHLERAILYQPAEDLRDLQILALLCSQMGDSPDPKHPTYRLDRAAVAIGLETIFVGLTQHLSDEPELGGVGGQALKYAVQNVAARAATTTEA